VEAAELAALGGPGGGLLGLDPCRGGDEIVQQHGQRDLEYRSNEAPRSVAP
jgi:hypothetical protein